MHGKGSFIFAQLRAYGHSADPKFLKEVNPLFDVVSASDIPLPTANSVIPRSLTIKGAVLQHSQLQIYH